MLKLIELFSHYYKGIHKSITESLLEVVHTFYKLSNDLQDWEQGLAMIVPFY